MQKIVGLWFAFTIAFQVSSAQTAITDIQDATTVALQDLQTSANNSLAAIDITTSTALGNLSELQTSVSNDLIEAIAHLGAFNNSINVVLALQVRALQTDLSNVLTLLTTTVSNASTEIQAAAANIKASIEATIAFASSQLADLSTNLQTSITNAINGASQVANCAREAAIKKIEQIRDDASKCITDARNSQNKNVIAYVEMITEPFLVVQEGLTCISDITHLNILQIIKSCGAAVVRVPFLTTLEISSNILLLSADLEKKPLLTCLSEAIQPIQAVSIAEAALLQCLAA